VGGKKDLRKTKNLDLKKPAAFFAQTKYGKIGSF
jgi:hypothetical protein